MIPVKTPWFVKSFFSDYLWDIKTTEKKIYLSFDDGPTPKITEWVLDMLDEYQAKATFFCIGNNVQKHHDIYEEILKRGHVIGNHTHNHLKGWKTSTNSYIENTTKAASFIKSHLFRPPYGKIKRSQSRMLKKMGYTIVMWDVLAKDWDKNIHPQTCVQHVIKNTRKGSIVVFHDSLKAERNMKAALKATLEYFSNRGYTFESI